MKIVGSRMLARALGLGLLAALASCGNSNDSGTAQVRVINASQDSVYSSLDFYTDAVLSVSAVTANTASAFFGVSSGTHPSVLTITGTATAVQSQDRTYGGNTYYDVVDYGWNGALKTFQIAENLGAPASGSASLRIVNTATDAGTLDIYVTTSPSLTTGISPLYTGVLPDNLTGFQTISAGTYNVFVTGTGKGAADIRLSAMGITLTSQEVASLMVTPTTSGVLTSALVVVQQGAITNFPNTLTRYRLVSSFPDPTTTVDVTIGGVHLTTSPLQSGFVSGTYTPVTAGASLPYTVTAKVGDTVTGTPTGTIAATAGQDVTLILSGDPANPTITQIADSNRLPVTAGDFDLRVVNALVGNDPTTNKPVSVSLAYNFSPLASSIAPLTSSSYTELLASSGNEIDVTSQATQTTIFSKSNITLASNGVYTVFLLGSASAPNGTLIKDR